MPPNVQPGITVAVVGDGAMDERRAIKSLLIP
jgi:hypothetical protein